MRLGRTRDALDTRSIGTAVRQRIPRLALRDLLNGLLLSAPVVTMIVLGYRQRWMSEDAFISLRVVEHLLAGNGPVFNAGERVEAHSNVLWVGMLALFGALGFDVIMVAVVLGLLLSAAGMFAGIDAAMRLDQHLTGDDESISTGFLVPVGAVVFIAVPVAADFLTSGLETGLGFGWLGVSFWALVCIATAGDALPRRYWAAGALLLGLGPLIRPDFAIYSAGFLLALLIFRLRSPSGGSRAADVILLVAPAGALPVAYQIFRMGYYAALAPNPALAKEAAVSNWGRGWTYLRDFVDPYLLWLPVAIILGWWAVRLAGGLRGRDWIGVILLAVPVLTAALHALYVVRVGGDFMHGRLLLPAFFTLLLPLAAVHVPLGIPPRAFLSGLAIGALLAWSAVAAFSLRSPLGAELDEETGLVDERAYYVEKAEHPNPVTAEDYTESEFRGAERGVEAREQAENGERAVMIDGGEFPVSDHVPAQIRAIMADGNIGILGYVAGLNVHTVDRLGLADPIGGRLEPEEESDRRPGHEKVLPMAWVSARFTALAPEDVDDPEFGYAREALRCGELVELHEAVTAPITLDRFTENIQRSWSFHNLRIPEDPEVAREQFCAE